MSQRANHFGGFERQNRMRNGRVMPIKSWGKSGHIFLDKDFNFLPIIYIINIKGQTNLEVNWTQIDHFILKKTQNAIFAKCQSPKSLLLHFSIYLSKTFRIDVNMDIANNLVRGFFI